MKITLDLNGAITEIKRAVDIQLGGAHNALVLVDGTGNVTLLDGDAKDRALDKIARSVLQSLIDYDEDEEQAEEASVHA